MTYQLSYPSPQINIILLTCACVMHTLQICLAQSRKTDCLMKLLKPPMLQNTVHTYWESLFSSSSRGTSWSALSCGSDRSCGTRLPILARVSTGALHSRWSLATILTSLSLQHHMHGTYTFTLLFWLLVVIVHNARLV